ncbi:hypothetical protein CES85_5285 [Ochrobactrum quorumnocens]|uniref:Uncharacterized protein n=1 Tax=Ochrobactrum quorumnocens TaxID=271865 RepID=A0A248UDM1_9HYPH|nr:hypothetical protein CES85_5285 [[Ochrobactrum] quorumnocens]
MLQTWGTLRLHKRSNGHAFKQSGPISAQMRDQAAPLSQSYEEAT